MTNTIEGSRTAWRRCRNGTGAPTLRSALFGSALAGLAFVALATPHPALARQPDGAAIYQSTCADCHAPGGIVPATRLEVIRAMSPEAIFTVLDRGMMAQQASLLTVEERRAVAEYLSLVDGRGALTSTTGSCAPGVPRPADFGSGPAWRAWGAGLRGTRFQPAAAAGLSAADVPGLQLRWAFAFPGVTSVRSQPAAAGERLFVAAVNGAVHALDARSGCVLWSYTASPPARGGLIVAEIAPGSHAVIIPGQAGDVHALDAETGGLLWRRSVSEHARTALTGTPLHHDGRIYVPVSAIEVFSALDSMYECCTFRGAVVALEAATGSVVWRYRTIDEEPSPRGTTSAGTTMWGPSGAPVWSSPTLDVARGRLYIGVGENFSHPTTATSDAVHAIDLATGQRVWSFQATQGDAWNMACGGSDAPAGFPRTVLPNCPEDNGPDYDFGIAPMIVSLPDGRELLVAGQKSGSVFALDPDRNGALVWETKVGRGGTLGGVHWGMAADEGRIFVPVSDRLDGIRYEAPARPGVAALDAATGEEVWFTPASRESCAGRSGCFPGYSAPAAATDGVVFAGALSGHLRAFAAVDGSLLWEFDAVRDFDAVNGVAGRGGAFDVAGPIISGGMVYAVSGYSTFGQMSGNVVLAFGP